MIYELYHLAESYKAMLILGHGLNIHYFLSERFVQIKLESGSMI